MHFKRNEPVNSGTVFEKIRYRYLSGHFECVTFDFKGFNRQLNVVDRQLFSVSVIHVTHSAIDDNIYVI